MLLTRRSLFGGLAAFVAAPAIVRATSIMPVKAFDTYTGSVTGDLVMRAKKLFAAQDEWVRELEELIVNPPSYPSLALAADMQKVREDYARALLPTLRPRRVLPNPA